MTSHEQNQEAQTYMEQVFHLMDGMETDEFLTIMTHCCLAVIAESADTERQALRMTSDFADVIEQTGFDLLPTYFAE